MSKHPWELIRSGAKDEALRLMQKAYEREPHASHIMHLGVGYLYVRDYQAAWEHFSEVNREDPTPTDIFYGMAGIAKWCLNEPDEAVAEWRAGLDSYFADAAGGVKLPLLMFCASVFRPKELPKLRAEAEKLLTKRASRDLIQNWPGPLEEFILGRIDEGTLRNKCQDENELQTSLNHWLADFYVGVQALARSDVARWAEKVRKTADTSPPEWANEAFFLGCLWNEEFFLARQEAAKAVRTKPSTS